jgi:hypothetical protein
MAAAAPAEDPLYLRAKKDIYKLFLRIAAVADASHDFQGGRAGGGGSIFDKIFKVYKDIGAPGGTTTKENEILSESQVMNLLLRYFGADTKKSGEAKAFKTAFLKGTRESPETVIGTYSRWNEDPYPFTVTSLLVASKDGAGKYNWTRDASQLHAFMNPNEADEVAFTIDAADVPFYDLFVEEELVGEGGSPKKIYYLNTREGISDAASKRVLAPPKPKKGEEPKRMAVDVITKEDTGQADIVYGAFDTARAAAGGISELESFFSDYSLNLSPIGLSAAGIPSTILSFIGQGVEERIQLLRTNTEDSHPNSVPALSSRIKGFLSRLFGSRAAPAPPPADRTKYHISLQQKRSGDWLQVLSCLQPERFGLKPSTRVTLVTLDKVCMAYALFMGVDVILTYKDEKKNKWLVRFNRSSAAAASELELFVKSAKALPASTIPVGEATREYDELKTMYTGLWDKKEDELEKAVYAAIDAAGPVDGDVKKILKHAMDLAVFRTLCPTMQKIKAGKEVNILEEYQKERGLAAGLSTAREAYKIYRQNYIILAAAMKRVAAAGGALDAGLKAYIASMQILKGGGEAGRAAADTYDLISRLKIVDGFLFRKGNAGVNGIGIFSYLNTGLKRGVISDIIEAMDSLSDAVPDVPKRERFKELVATARLLVGESAEGPSVAAVPNEVLVGAMEESVTGNSDIPFGPMMPMMPMVAVAEGGARIKYAQKVKRKTYRISLAKGVNLAAAGTLSKSRSPRTPGGTSRSRSVSAKSKEADESYWTDRVHISDYGAALSILAARFQNDLRTEAKGGLNLRTQAFESRGADINMAGGARLHRRHPLLGMFKKPNKLLDTHRPSVTLIKQKAKMGVIKRSAPRHTIHVPEPKMGGKFQHNPLATLYIFMKELSYRLTFETDENVIETYQNLLTTIKGVIISLNVEGISILRVLELYVYELRLLQGTAAPASKDDKAIAARLGQDILTSYYGIVSAPNINEQEGYFVGLSRMGPSFAIEALFPIGDIVALARYLGRLQAFFSGDAPMRSSSVARSMASSARAKRVTQRRRLGVTAGIKTLGMSLKGRKTKNARSNAILKQTFLDYLSTVDKAKYSATKGSRVKAGLPSRRRLALHGLAPIQEERPAGVAAASAV